jgi:hypothetical protein
VEQSVWRLTTDWTTGIRSPAEANDFSCSLYVHTSSEADPVSYPMVLPPGLKCSRGVTLTTHPHLVPRSRMSRSYISSPLGVCMAVAGQLYFIREWRQSSWTTAGFKSHKSCKVRQRLINANDRRLSRSCLLWCSFLLISVTNVTGHEPETDVRFPVREFWYLSSPSPERLWGPFDFVCNRKLCLILWGQE